MVIRDPHAPDFRRFSPAILNAIRIALSYIRAGGMPSSISKLLPLGEKLLGVEQISRIRLSDKTSRLCLACDAFCSSSTRRGVYRLPNLPGPSPRIASVLN